ncbi:hydroxyisourate hydrolase [Streptomyces sp. NPDC056323]|uniref:hydroxyisourate hydrolase n=1 Tax=Streptomyces sp. NPDC056323 TaxID=3345784 RepID=UPI0035DD9F70
MTHEDKQAPEGDAPSRRKLLRAGLVLGPAVIAPMGFAGTSSAADPATGPSAGRAKDKPAVPPVEPSLTIHAIDTYHGATEAGLPFDLSVFRNGRYQLIEKFETLAGGRTKDPLLGREELRTGRYEIKLHLAEYFSRTATGLPKPGFLDEVPIRFLVTDATQHYHTAILFTPWNYSYYRGS